MKKILVIDDEEWLREMVNMALRQRGFEVVEAENGVKGIDAARRELPDLILCDVNMGKVDGYLTLSSLRNEPATGSIPFILMTGLADNAGMRHGMELGADDYLPKPFTIDGLYAAVEARLKKSQALREEAERKLATLRDSISMALPHELRTPLNGIMAYGEILVTDAAVLKPAELVEMGQVISHSGHRLERLVENFLIHAQLELLRTDPQKSAALKGQMTASAARIISDKARQQVDGNRRTADLTLAVADVPAPVSHHYLAKIVDELVLNACKFSKPGTPVRVSASTTGNIWTLTVSDRGRGMTPEQIAVVGAYVQFDRKLHEQQGLGMGLAIAKRLVELHGGALSIQSDEETGTAVSVKIPVPASA